MAKVDVIDIVATCSDAGQRSSKGEGEKGEEIHEEDQSSQQEEEKRRKRSAASRACI
jgi:hypothetical protein